MCSAGPRCAIFYDGYRALAAQIQSLPAAFAFHFALLVVPTTLMGLSLPLLSRGVVRDVGEARSVVSRLYAVNTLGAAAGAAVGGWFLLGNLGFDGHSAVRQQPEFARGGSRALALARRRTKRVSLALPATHHLAPAPLPLRASRGSGRGWLCTRATGAAALALEVVYFRLVDGIMRSNSYTFAHVLTLYLILFGAGAAAAGSEHDGLAHPT